MFQGTAIAPQLYADHFAGPGGCFPSRRDHRFHPGSPESAARPAPPGASRPWLARLGIGIAAVSATVLVSLTALPPRPAEAAGTYRCMATSCDPTYSVKEAPRSAAETDDAATTPATM